MIKKNQTQKQFYKDKYAHKYLGNQDDSKNRKIDQTFIDEILTSGKNKKYHQYKQQKQMKNKNVQYEQNYIKNQNRPPLKEKYQTNIQSKIKLTRDYDYKEKEEQEEEYLIKKYQKQIPKQQNHLIQDLKHDYSMPFKQNIRNNQNKYELSQKLLSPKPENRKKIQIKCEDLNNNYSYNQRKDRRRSYSSSFLSSFPKKRNHIKLKLNYEQIDQSEPIFKLKIHKTQSKIDNFTKFNNPIHNSEKKQQLNKQPIKIQQISLKIKQISNFNIQINQRIRGIIGGFTNLKNKL